MMAALNVGAKASPLIHLWRTGLCLDTKITIFPISMSCSVAPTHPPPTMLSIPPLRDQMMSKACTLVRGMLNAWDLRAGKSFFKWVLHEYNTINSIDFNPRNPHVMATSSEDGTARLWDLRSIGGGPTTKPKTLRTLTHSKPAYFSPTGLSLATTRGVWGWDDSYIFVGNRPSKGIDVISTKLKRRVKELQDPLMKTIPCRIHCHPLNVGVLAGSTAGGHVYVWTPK